MDFVCVFAMRGSFAEEEEKREVGLKEREWVEMMKKAHG